MDAFAMIGAALVDGPGAWLPEELLAAELACSPERLAVAVAGLVAGGLLDRWELPAGPVVTLTPLGAAQLGLRLLEGKGLDVYRWSSESVSVRSRRPTAAGRARSDRKQSALEQWPDDHNGSISRHNARPIPRRPLLRPGWLPSILLCGDTLVPWEELRPPSDVPPPDVHCAVCRPKLRKRTNAPPVVLRSCRACGYGLRRRPGLGHCAGCRGMELSRTTYCLRCDRWGLDGFFRRRGFGPPLRRPKVHTGRKVA